METQIEKNLKQSFSYVKKDLIAVNEAIADIKTKIQHLSMNQASLVSLIEKIKTELNILKFGSKKKR
jgi:archaellum component FlaC